MPIVPYLPKGKGELISGLKKRGTWEENEKLIEKLPNELDITAEATKDVLTAIPTVWARPVLFAEALFDKRHPLHQEVTNEWRGLLGIFCFKKVYNFNIEAKLVEIDPKSKYDFVQILSASPKPGKEEEWRKIYLIYVDKILIGATSPKSLFFTPPEYSLPEYIPWKTEEGFLTDPAIYFKKENALKELRILEKWVMKISEKVKGQDIGEVFKTWLEIIRSEASLPEVKDFNIKPISEEVSPLFQYADYEEEKRSGDFYLKSSKKGGGIIVADKKIWERERDRIVSGSIKVNEMLRVFECRTPEAMKEFFTGRGIKDDVVFPTIDFLTEKVLKLPLHQGYTISNGSWEFVLPLKKEILNYFKPEEVGKYFQWEETEEGMMAKLTLPLETDTKGRERSITIEKLYKREDIVEVPKVPIIGLWPNFSSDDWYWYYLIIEKTEGNVKWKPVSGEERERKEDVIWKSSKPIEGVVCEYDTTPVGLIIPKFSSPESIKGNEWFVGVDFGTSNTTVCYKEGKEGVPTLLRFEDRTLKLTRRADVEIKDFFIPRFMPFWEKESFTSIYRILKTGGGGPKSEEMVLDGILLHLDTYPAYPITLTRGDVKPNLKWTTETKERDYILNFLQHLVLLIMAEARANGIKTLTFYSSYPSAFINQWISDLKGNWESGIVQKFNIERGFTINFSEEKFQTESVAACKYWVGKSEMAIGRTIASCVFDIGGGTTDIGIWMTTGSKPELKAQASIILAGNILTDFILRDKDFYIKLIESFSEDPQKWRPTFEGIWDSSNKGLLVPALINTILKRKKEAEIIGEVRRQAYGAFKKPRTLIMFGGGALLYYLGLLLRDIKREVDLEGCEIFFSGNGSKLLKWICVDSDLFKNLRKIIQKSADFDPQKPELIKFHYSEDPKEEVAIGLLFEGEMGKVEPKKIIGETGYSYQNAVLEWNRDMKAVESMDFSKITVPNEFPELEAYITIYNQIAEDIGLDNMNYQPEFIKNRIEFLLSQVDPKKVELIQPFFIEEVKEVLNRYLQQES